ncbi:enolase C-terminal domain-like protein [Streptomyces sp. NPDC004244]|uniref:enolase C-terminal domain-like protein n=1 Tax=Streptomyces sp. NPDC101206 TaxID=3366128 RepID=UPI0037F2E878
MPEPATARLYRVELPMAVGFDHPARKRSASDSLVLALDVDGFRGIGECAPRRYVTGETTASVTAALQGLPLEAVAASLRGADPADLLARLLREGAAAVHGLPGGNNLHCLVETALLDLLGKRLGLSGAELVPGGPRDAAAGPPAALPVSQVLDLSLDTDAFLDTRGPFHFVKVKASYDIAHDVRTVARIRARLGERVPVMVDANMSWTPYEALGHVQALRDAGATFIEEPLPQRAWAELARLRAEGGLPIMLDESVCTLDDARAAVAHGACDALNIRVAKNGGPVAAARLAGFAREHGLGFQIGVQVAEVGPLITAGRALAFRHPDALTVEAGQSDRFFPDMIVSPRPAVDREANTIGPAPGPGFGLELDPRADRWAVARRTEGDPTWRPAAPAAAHAVGAHSALRTDRTEDHHA